MNYVCVIYQGETVALSFNTTLQIPSGIYQGREGLNTLREFLWKEAPNAGGVAFENFQLTYALGVMEESLKDYQLCAAPIRGEKGGYKGSETVRGGIVAVPSEQQGP